MISISALKKTFVLQKDESDPGYACLLSIANYYGTGFTARIQQSYPHDKTVNITDLYCHAKRAGFKSEVVETDIANLSTLKNPCILPVQKEGPEHYIILYRASGTASGYIIGDPACGITDISATELSKIWKSKLLLRFDMPNKKPIEKKTIGETWSLLSGYFMQNPVTLTINILLALLCAACLLGIASLTGQLISLLPDATSPTQFIQPLLAMTIILLLRSAIHQFRQQLLSKHVNQLSKHRTGAFFHHLVHLPKAFFDRKSLAEFIYQRDLVPHTTSNINAYNNVALQDIVILAAGLLFLSWQAAVLLLVPTATLFILFLVNSRASQLIQQFYDKQSRLKQQNLQKFMDLINGISIVKTMNAESPFIATMNTVNNLKTSETMKQERLKIRLDAFAERLNIFMVIMTTAVAVLPFFHEKLNPGALSAALVMTIMLMPVITRLSALKLRLLETENVVNSLQEYTDRQPEYPEQEKEELESIYFKKLKISGLKFRFPGKPFLLKDISFDVSRGETIALLGENGSGKSTIIALLQKLYQPHTGLITLNEQSIAHISTPSWRNIIAVVPQEINLFEGSILENITLTNKQQECNAALAFCIDAGFNPFFEQMPQGYHTQIGPDGKGLSGGQKQLIAIARALYRRPQLLLLDEPTSAMDTKMEHFVMQLLSNVQSRTAIILVTHKSQMTRISDHIYVLEKGKLTDPYKFAVFNS